MDFVTLVTYFSIFNYRNRLSNNVFANKHLTYVLVMKVYDWWYNRYSMDQCRSTKVKNTLHHCCVG